MELLHIQMDMYKKCHIINMVLCLRWLLTEVNQLIMQIIIINIHTLQELYMRYSVAALPMACPRGRSVCFCTTLLGL